MNFEDLHNELNSFPDDLKYTDARWESALSGIKAYEAKRRKLGLIGALGFVVLVTSMFFPVSGDMMELTAEYSPRENVQYDVIDSQDDYKNEFEFNIRNSQSANGAPQVEQKTNPTDKSALIAAVDRKEEEVKDDSQELTDEKEFSEAKESPIVENLTAPNISDDLEFDLVINDTGKPIEAKNSILAKPSTRVDVMKIDQPQSSFSYSENNALKPLNPYSGVLVSKNTNLRIQGEKQKVKLANGFRIPKSFWSWKVGASPWAEYGRSKVFGKLNPTFGLFYEKTLSPAFSVNIGGDYSTIENIDLPVSSAHTIYGLGFESNVTTIHTNKIHVISLPLNVNVRLQPRVQVTGGLGFSYLLTANNTLEEHFVTNNSSELLKSRAEKGYITSFNQMLFYSNVGVSYWASERNKIGVEYQIGLTDFSIDDAFNTIESHRNSKVQISVSRIFR